MHGKDSKGSGLWAPGIVVLWAVLAAAAGGGASAAPVETVLYSFTGGASDGIYPSAGLIADSQGISMGRSHMVAGRDAAHRGLGPKTARPSGLDAALCSS
jgi:hypothetical protein